MYPNTSHMNLAYGQPRASLPLKSRYRDFIDFHGKYFHLQSTAASLIATRRERRRSLLPDPEAAAAEHARKWREYVFEHDGYFEEQADKIREVFVLRGRLRYMAEHPREAEEVVCFRPINYSPEMPREGADDMPVSPRTKMDHDYNLMTTTLSDCAMGKPLEGRFADMLGSKPIQHQFKMGFAEDGTSVRKKHRTIFEVMGALFDKLTLRGEYGTL